MALDLCIIRQAEKPYYIENISTPIWSIEELCYYLYANVYLIDDTICNELLCDWLRDELDMKKLYQTLYTILENQGGSGQFVMAIFREIGYLTNQQMRDYQEKLRSLEVQPDDSRSKLKGDYLVRCGMYANAISEYRQLLEKRPEGNLGAPFYTSVWNNLGSAYARMFQFEEAADCFLQAWKLSRTREMLRRYISALPLYLSEEEYRTKLTQLGADEELIRVIQEYNARIVKESLAEQDEAAQEDPGQQLQELLAEYCRRAKAAVQ